VNVHELPMMIFTILAQMSVGAFVVLGVVQVVASRRYGKEAVDTVTDPALYAIGPAMVLGLIASMFHMNDVMNTFNVLRHFNSSWLTREIVCGVVFAGLGFLFALLQWFKWGSPRLRQALACVTAVVGLVLVYAMSMIYYSLTVVPAWNTWATPAQFYTTTFLLGALAVGAALMGSVMWKARAAAHHEAKTSENAPAATARAIVTSSLKGVGVAAVVLLGIEFIIIPLYISTLSGGGDAATQSAAVFSGAWFVARLVRVLCSSSWASSLVARSSMSR
jgi:anaerobic dimethyl sulfoxide reductase subunit C